MTNGTQIELIYTVSALGGFIERFTASQDPKYHRAAKAMRAIRSTLLDWNGELGSVDLNRALWLAHGIEAALYGF